MAGSAQLIKNIEKVTNSKVSNFVSIGGGCTNQAYRVDLSTQGSLFCKTGAQAPTAFACEAHGLQAMARCKELALPRVIYSDPNMLLLSYIEPGLKQKQTMYALGTDLARLHLTVVHDQFGFFEDNFIGMTPQRNTFSGSWIEFFRTERLGFQIELAKRRGLAKSELIQAIQALDERLNEVIPDDGEPPCLVHGDLWAGNYMVGRGGRAYLIDPAAYYGHREIDLALTSLFGGYAEDFYAGYDSIYPRTVDYEDRVPLYQLYHLLNHLNIMGSSYHEQCLAAARFYL